MLKKNGSGDDRCLNCKSQRCFVCEHKKVIGGDESINYDDINKNDIKDNSNQNNFLISTNITSLNSNDPRCLACRIQRCFQVIFLSLNQSKIQRLQLSFSRLIMVI